MTEISSDNKTLSSQSLETIETVPPVILQLWDKSKAGARLSLKFLAKHLLNLTCEIGAIVLGLAFMWFCAINFVLLKDDVDISFLGRNAEIWFSEAFNGHNATIGSMTLDWKGVDNGFIFAANSISIKDKQGVEIENIGLFKSEVGVRAALTGKLEARRVSIEGGVVSFVRNKDGQFTMGLGAPEHVGTFGPVLTGKRGKPRAPAALPEMKFPKDLKSFDLQNGQAFIIDKKDGLNLVLENTKLSYRNSTDRVRADLEADLRGQAAEVSQKDPSVKLSFFTETKTPEAEIGFSVQDINPSLFAPERGPLSGLSQLKAPLNLTTDIVTTSDTGLITANLTVDIGDGSIELMGQEEPLKTLAFSLDYDRPKNVVHISDLKIDTQHYGANGTLKLKNVFNGRRGLSDTIIPMSMELTDVRLDLKERFQSPFEFPYIRTNASYTPKEQAFELSSAELNFGTYIIKADVSGHVGDKQAEDKKGLKFLSVNAGVSGLFTEKDLIAVWPVEFAKGARNWIKRSVTNARIENLLVDVKLTEEVLSGAPLQDENLLMTFDIPQADVRYISTMTPYLGATGSGWMRGNRAQFKTDGGRVGNLDVTRGQVDFPQLFPKGGLLSIDLDASGPASDMLALIDEKPFMFASQYGVNPADFGGTGNVNLKITRPLLVNFDRSRITYSGNGKFQDVRGPFGIGKHKITQGDVELDVDKEGMSVKGPVLLGPWRTEMTMRETFDQGATPTQFTLEGPMTQSDLDGFGLGGRAYFGGMMQVSAQATGSGVNISQARVKADLTQAELTLGSLWSKPQGLPSEIYSDVVRDDAGALAFNNIQLTAPGVNAVGSTVFTPDFKLVEMDLPQLSVDGLLKGAVKSRPNASGDALDVQIDGEFMDITTFMDAIFSGEPSEFKVPVNIQTRVDRLIIKPSYSLKNASLDFLNLGGGVERAEVSGAANDGNFFARIEPNEIDGGRLVNVTIPNASDIAFAFFDMDNITGGTMTVTADLPEVGEKGMVRGTVEVKDFTLVEAPILAQMLSLASLKGVSDVFGGSGLSFRELSVPFGWEEGKLSVRDARASGAALGLTGNGEISFTQDYLDLDGVLVPAYTANSILGDLPIFGDLFVGKKGEGIFALNYAIKGTMEQSQVAVNPLSALTPGFLRRIFAVKRSELPEETQKAIESVNPKAE